VRSCAQTVGDETFKLRLQGNSVTSASLAKVAPISCGAQECPPVGSLEDSLFVSTTFQLEIGDTLVFYTDGVTESENSEGKAFGHKRLQRVLYDCRTQDPHRILEVILNELEAHSAGRLQTDDITLVIIQVEDAAGSSPATLADFSA